MRYTPEQVAEMCDEFVRAWPKSENGPAHVVLSDYNFEDCFISECVANINAMLENRWNPPPKHSLDELVATYAFLGQLLLIPEEQRVFNHAS